MAIYTNLPVYKASYSLMLAVNKIMQDSPRECRYTLGQDVRRKIMDIILQIYQANRIRTKLDKILRMRESLLEVQVYLRLMSDMRYISDKKYMMLADMTADISKQMSSWERYERNKVNDGEKWTE